MEKAATSWSVPVTVDDIPDSGLHMAIEAPAAVRTAVAKLAAVRDVSELSAEFDLTRQGAGVHVSGRVSAELGQTCVVSLEPIETTVEETIDVTFAPAADSALGPSKSADDEPPEPLVDGTVDLGALATEFLLLGIDPYPRKAGVQFAAPKAEEDGERPFAALATLKNRLGGSQS